jgi:hypothetical protein
VLWPRVFLRGRMLNSLALFLLDLISSDLISTRGIISGFDLEYLNFFEKELGVFFSFFLLTLIS